MNTSDNGLDKLIDEEGEKTKAYRDSRGTWTIGVGHTSAAGPPEVVPGLVLTPEEVKAVLARDLRGVEEAINSLVKVTLNQNQFDALVSLVFNIGAGGFKTSTVLRKLNAGDYVGAGEAFLMWTKAGNSPDLLLPRRQREKLLFDTPVAIPQPKGFIEWISSLFSPSSKK